MTFNIHHGEGLDGKVDLDRISKVILEANADAVALQEVDRNTRRAGGVDMVQELGKRTDMHVAFGSNLDFQGGNMVQQFLASIRLNRLKIMCLNRLVMVSLVVFLRLF